MVFTMTVRAAGSSLSTVPSVAIVPVTPLIGGEDCAAAAGESASTHPLTATELTNQRRIAVEMTEGWWFHRARSLLLAWSISD